MLYSQLYEDACGTYYLFHKLTGLFYIGSSQNIRQRMANHASTIQSGSHKNPKLRELDASWTDFVVQVYYFDTLQEARSFEKELIANHIGNDKFCNVATDPFNPMSGVNAWESAWSAERKGGFTGHKHTESTKLQMSLDRRGVKCPNVSLAISRAVSVNGITYQNPRVCGERIGVTENVVKGRIKSTNPIYADWFYVGESRKFKS